MKRDFALGGGHLANMGRQAGSRISVTEHFDVAAERDSAELPPRAGAVPPTEQLGTEADREDLDFNPVAPGDQIMPKLVDEDEHGEYKKENTNIKNPTLQKEKQIVHWMSISRRRSRRGSRL